MPQPLFGLLYLFLFFCKAVLLSFFLFCFHSFFPGLLKPIQAFHGFARQSIFVFKPYPRSLSWGSYIVMFHSFRSTEVKTVFGSFPH